MIEIKQASINDIPLLMKWRITVLRDVFCLPPDYNVKELERTNNEYYSQALRNNEHIACFAQNNNIIIGCGGMCLQKELPSPDNPSGKCAYIMNIYVCPEYRNCGTGENIVRWLTRRAKDLQITKIYLESTVKAKKLYSSIGYKELPNFMFYAIDGNE